MFSFLLVVQILVSVSIIALVMLQQGKGADMGAGFGAGSSGTVFGSRGSGSFFTRATGILAAVFFINCLLIASPLIRKNMQETDALADQIEQQAVQQQEVEQEEAVINALEEQSADSPAMTIDVMETDVPETDVTEPGAAESDLPAIADEPPVAPVADDLPE
jgi:preprotein translocase subunit SecG